MGRSAQNLNHSLEYIRAIVHPATLFLLVGLVLAAAPVPFGPPVAQSEIVPTAPPPAPVTLDPGALMKYADPLPVPGPMPQSGPDHYEIGMWAVPHRFSSQLPVTTVWGYGPTQATASYPAATIEAVRHRPITVHWTNHLPMTHLLADAVDPTLHMAEPGAGVPTVVHLHGGETEPPSDGHPDAWFTQGFLEKGTGWVKETFTYYNEQPPATLWYHDHALGYTRLNVYAGLAGFYLLRDPGHEPAGLPTGPYEIPIVIQDRMLRPDGSLYYPNVGDNTEHPVWVPEFFGDIIVVNGTAWPNLNVEPRKYRFRFLNGSSARFYSMRLEDRATEKPGPAFVQIGTDGGYLPSPVVLNDPRKSGSPRLVLAPGERADVVIDFSGLRAGTRLVLTNIARAPFPKGAPPDPQTSGQIMQFTVGPRNGADPSRVPSTLNTIPALGTPQRTRTLTLNELMGDNGPLAALLNGQMWDGPVSEMPELGSTEVWEIANLTGDTHPIHLHAVQFQLVSRQRFRAAAYQAAWSMANPEVPADEITSVPVGPYLQGPAMPPDPNERGWKDTFRMNPGEVTRVIVRFSPIDGSAAYPYDATAEPGYVWHCHILEHEDNEMMRPLKLVPAAPTALASLSTEASTGLETRVETGGIAFSLAAPGRVDIDVFSVTGQRVRTLARGAFVAGRHVVPWDGRGDAGEQLASGVYFYRVMAARKSESGKLIVVR